MGQPGLRAPGAGTGGDRLTRTNSPRTVASTVASRTEMGTSAMIATHWRQTTPQESAMAEMRQLKRRRRRQATGSSTGRHSRCPGNREGNYSASHAKQETTMSKSSNHAQSRTGPIWRGERGRRGMLHVDNRQLGLLSVTRKLRA